MAVELVPIGRVPLVVNNVQLAGCESVDFNFNAQVTPHAGAAFADHTVGPEFTTVNFTFAVLAQVQEFDAAVATVPAINGVRRFDVSYTEGSVTYLIKRCINNSATLRASELSGDASLTRSVVGTKRIPLSAG